MIRHASYAIVVMAALALSACQATPQTPRQALAASYITVETLAQSVEQARLGGLLDDSQAQEAKVQLLRSLVYLDIAATQIDAGQAGEDPLLRAHAILTALQTILLEVSHEQPR